MKNKLVSRSARRALLLAVLALGSVQAGATQLIQNGGFEDDGFAAQPIYNPTAWSVAESFGIGGVAIDSALTSHASSWAAAGPASGNNYASIDAYSLGAYTLSQSFSTSALSKATLSFQMYVNDQSANGNAHVGSDLNYENSADLYYARVDILKTGTDSFATGSDVVKSLYIGGATGRKYNTESNAYLNYAFDLSNVLASGGNYTLRFAVANNTVSQMQMGIDNVSLQVTAVPEPESYALMLAGLGLIGVAARRRTRR